MNHPVSFIHISRNPRFRYSIAYSFDKTPDGFVNINYGIAQCRPTDEFNRAEGRKMATARYNKAVEGKTASVLNKQTGKAVVPMYGSLTVKDHDGLSVSRFIAETFETDRNKVLASK